HRASAHLAGELPGVTGEELPPARVADTSSGDGHGRKCGAFGLHVHVPLLSSTPCSVSLIDPPPCPSPRRGGNRCVTSCSAHQKKSDSHPMRRPVTLPKVPVAAGRGEPRPRPARLR